MVFTSPLSLLSSRSEKPPPIPSIMWSSWFGGGSGSSTSSPSSSSTKKNPTPKDAILGLRQQLDMLQKREVHLENQIEEADRLARKNVNTNKTAARGALRKKKMHEHNLEQLQAQIATMEQNVMAIETANINYANLEVMRQAGKAMKKIHNGLDMDKVETIMYVLLHRRRYRSLQISNCRIASGKLRLLTQNS